MTFVVWGIILEVKSDADLENDICKRISQRLGVVSVGFNVIGVVFRTIFIFFPLELCWVSLYRLNSTLITKIRLQSGYLDV